MGIKTKCYTLTEKMFPVCPVLMQHFVRHCSGSQTMALRSSDPETRRVPASFHSRQLTHPVCPSSSVSSPNLSIKGGWTWYLLWKLRVMFVFISRFLICIAILRASMSSSVLFREKSHCSQQLPRKKKHSWFHEHMEKFWRRYHLTSQKQRPFRQSDGLS